MMKGVARTAAFLAAIVALNCGLAQGETVLSGEVIQIDYSGDTGDDNHTGIVIWNTSAGDGNVSIGYLPTNPSGTPDEGFCLLDGTLQVTTDLLPGDLRLLVIRDVDRARLRRARRVRGLRRETIRVMRRKRREGSAIWHPARCRSRRMARIRRAEAPVRALRRKQSGLLGQRGIAPDESYVWAVVDQASDFAVGGLIPEPITLACLLVPAGLLLVKRPGKT